MSSMTQNSGAPYGNSGEFSAITKSGAGKFPNPFFDIASEYVPRNLRQIFEWSEYLYLTYGTYRSAARKVVRYFLTELVLDGESESEREEYQEFLDNDMHLLTELAQIGDDFMTYGNVFVSIYFPFDRLLICPDCSTHYHVDTIPYKFSMRDKTFRGNCPKCRTEKAFRHLDVRSMDKKRVRIIRWNPKDMRLRVHPISGEVEYYLELDSQFINKLRDGNRFYLNSTPWSMIEAAAGAGTGERPLYLFDDGGVYHMKEATLAGLPIKGWGIPPILPNFKLAYYIQILRRYDEAIALDFIVPFRVLHPTGGGASNQGVSNDPLQMMNMDNFVSRMQGLVAAKRKNLTDIQVSPFPIGYEMFGGEAKTLAPKDNIAQAMDELLNAVGFPAELYRGSLSIQAFPVALRLFEKTWGSLVDGYDDLIAWILERIAKYFMWGTISGSLRSVTLADDIERKALALQAAAGMDISKGTAYKPLGIDFMDEQQKVVEEQREVQKLQEEAMEEQEAAQMGGGPEGGGGPGGQAGATPGDVHAQAKELAYQLVTQTPETLRRGELIKIKHSNPTLHALVIQEMDTLRAELSRQGQAMMIQQEKQGRATGGAGELPSAMALGLLINMQASDYTRANMRKLAVDINIPGVRGAFSFIYRRMKGWE